MNLSREDVEKRIKELDNAINQQAHYVQQMNNQILMFHGAKEEYNVILRQIELAEKLEQERLDALQKEAEKASNENDALPENSCGEPNNECAEL